LAVETVQTSGRILDAAERCMARYGLRRVSMGDVAAEARVSRGSVYRYFADRDALVEAVLERTADRFVAASEPDLDQAPDLVGQVAAALGFILRHGDDEAFTLRLPGETDSLFATLLTVRREVLFGRWVAFWEPRLADAERRGEVRPGLDRAQTGELIVRLLLSFAVLPTAVSFDAGDPDATARFVRDHLLRGLTR
jgi:AcrR family transcriptional regulator